MPQQYEAPEGATVEELMALRDEKEAELAECTEDAERSWDTAERLEEEAQQARDNAEDAEDDAEVIRAELVILSQALKDAEATELGYLPVRVCPGQLPLFGEMEVAA